MNARTIRRAQERKARKEALKSSRRESSNFEKAAESNLEISPAQLQANRLNAQFSTGPRSEAGRAKSSLNAVKTGLTGKTVLLSSDDVKLYAAHVHRFLNQYQPEGDRQMELVQSLADTQWRINRIPALEMGIYALAQIEFADEFEDFAPEQAAALIQAQAFIKYQKQLNNLSIQETRLRRQYQKDLAELKQLQQERSGREAKSPSVKTAVSAGMIENGFEFSTATNNRDTLCSADETESNNHRFHSPAAA